MANQVQDQRRYAAEQVAAERASAEQRLSKMQKDSERRIQALHDQVITSEAVVAYATSTAGRGAVFPAISRKIKAIRLMRSGLFDAEWYVTTYPDALQSGMSPAAHYLETGFSRSYRPNPFFDTRFYLDRNEDVRREARGRRVDEIAAPAPAADDGADPRDGDDGERDG